MQADELQAALTPKGWTLVERSSANSSQPLPDQIRAVARLLGEIVPGRNRALIEQVVPQSEDSAYAGSLSSVYGLNPLPLHTDTAHWPVPCRYLVIGCAEPGPEPVPTNLLDSRKATLSEEEVTFCRRAPFLIRNGRSSFYGSIMEKERAFVRLDRGCMTAVTEQGTIALDAFNPRRHESKIYSHQWNVGDILVIDNWRVLHGRGGEKTAHGRVLLRAMIR